MPEKRRCEIGNGNGIGNDRGIARDFFVSSESDRSGGRESLRSSRD